ncbi:hypothetical protein QQF64_031590 [Cirrhinus molitorella]|uniref:ribonuclease H n=1 Tax=Cirrhinus molitorella TaxID=172907 RepID=A0ABR3MXI3_9TELE
MEELLKCLTEVSIRQQQIVEHIATRQGEADRELAALRAAAAQTAPPPDPRITVTQLLPKMTANDDVENYLQMFENVATREGWAREDWARLLAPLLTGEAQRAYFSLSAAASEKYEELKQEILARMGLSPICAAQQFHEWEYKPWVPARAQAAELINPHLSAAQKTELQHLVGQFSDVFSILPGRTNVITHDIRTPPGVIVRQRPYRVPEARRQAIEEEIQEMLKLGVIEPSRSPWSSPIVMVPKPDGTLRFCNDFRRLNEISEFDGYPMPRVDELLDRLGRARYISTLDLTKGYWQVALTDEAKPKTAFSTPSGHWQYRTLPFGLHGAPATFQRMMDVLLRPHQAYAAAYLDDVVVHSEPWEDHLDRLRRVLLELRRAGLTANPKKCHLALSEAKYLGYQVDRGLIRPQEKKVAAILSAPRPSSKTQVRAFLGLVGYYRCFIPNFSSLAAPLTDLTRKGQPERTPWGPTEEEAFRAIKAALTSEPVLRAPDFNCPFLLQTDASDTGLGAVLSQIQDDEEHPVIFISRKLTSAERRYATVEREALAVKWAVLELRITSAANSLWICSIYRR